MADGNHYIEARLRDLLSAMRVAAPQAPEAHAKFEEVVRVIAALYHYSTFAELNRLKDLYDPLDPDRAPPPAGPGAAAAAFGAFAHALEPVLAAANFEETAFDAIGRRAQTDVLSDLRIKASNSGIRAIRFFSRGAHTDVVELKSMFGLRKRRLPVEILEDVVLLVAFRDASEIKPAERKALARMRRGVRPGAVLIKLFSGIARHQLSVLHPGATPTMRTRDQFFLGVPALAGGAPLLLQIGPAISVIFALVAGYFGVGAAIDDSAYKRAIAAISGLVAVGAFVMRQWLKYQRQALIYQKRLADTIYYRNVANNHGVLATLISAAEEQDVKESALAYWALLAADAPLTAQAVDSVVETLLRERCATNADFEIEDALRKLEALGLITRDGETFRALQPDDALVRLDHEWDNLFSYTKAKPDEE